MMDVDGQPVRVKALASGSSANALLIESPAGSLLVDAGLSAKVLQELLARHAVFHSPLCAILITHEHGDHCIGANGLARKTGAPLVATTGTLGVLAPGRLVPTRPLAAGSTLTIGPFEVHAFPVPHDAVDPVGYRIETAGWRIGVATDLGHCSRHVREGLGETHLTIIEANHDRGRLATNPNYPDMLRRRISGDRGHLANEQTAELLQELADRDQDRWVWLAHLSEENNKPSIALAAMSRHFQLLRRPLPFEVQVAKRDRPSVEWDTRALFRQRALF